MELVTKERMMKMTTKKMEKMGKEILTEKMPMEKMEKVILTEKMPMEMIKMALMPSPLFL